MKTVKIPAQITTVEDKIMGNLTLSQLSLLMAALFSSALIYILFPPYSKLTILKGVIMAVVSLILIIMSIKIRGKLFINWLIIILLYHYRPRIYVYSKNDNKKIHNNHHNTVNEPLISQAYQHHQFKPSKTDRIEYVSNERISNTPSFERTEDTVRGESILDRNVNQLNFQIKKRGEVNVTIN